MISTLKKKLEKRFHWQLIIASSLIGFLLSLVLAAIGFLASFFLLFLGTPSNSILHSILIWLFPGTTLLITLALVQEHAKYKKWLHVLISGIIMSLLWLLFFWIVTMF